MTGLCSKSNWKKGSGKLEGSYARNRVRCLTLKRREKSYWKRLLVGAKGRRMREDKFGCLSGTRMVGGGAATAVSKDSEKGRNEWVIKSEKERKGRWQERWR